MALSLWTGFGLAALGAAGVLVFEHTRTAARLEAGALVPIEYTVLGTQASARGKSGARVEVRWIDPGTGQAVSRSLPVGSTSDEAAARYPVGAVRKGWLHTGLEEPYLREEKPDPVAEARVALFVAAGLTVFALGLLGFAWRTGRLWG